MSTQFGRWRERLTSLMPAGPASSRPPAPRPKALLAVESAAIVGLAWAFSHGPLAGLPGAGLPALAALLVGARAGYTAGIAAGGAAAAVAIVEAGLAPGQLLSPLGPRVVMATVGMALGLGTIGGLVGDAHRNALARSKAEAADLKKRLDELRVRYDVIVSAKEAQDRRLVGQFHTLSTLYEAAKALDVLEPSAVLPATLKLARDFLEADAVAIYALEEGKLKLVDALGDRPHRPPLLPRSSLAARAARSREVEAFDPAQGDAPDAWLAAPLLGKDNRTRAVIVVEQIAFLRLTPDARQLLSLLADWAGRALATTEAHAEARAQQVLDPVTGVHQAKFMMTQLHREWSLAKRYGLPLSVLLVRQPALEQLEGAERDAAAASLANALRNALRQIDPVGHFRTTDAFIAILPVTPPENGRMLAERFANLAPGIIVASAGNDQGETAEDLLQSLQRDTRLVEAGA